MGRSRRSRPPRRARRASRRPQGAPGEAPRAPEPGASVDLHNLRPEEALRALERALHTARVRGAPTLTVITGRGLGNARQEPVLRGRVETWLGSEGRRFGALDWRPIALGGALEVRLSPP